MERPEDTRGGGRATPEELEHQRRDLIAAAVSPELRPLVDAMNEQGYAANEQLEKLRRRRRQGRLGVERLLHGAADGAIA
jgi:hypothetical protein